MITRDNIRLVTDENVQRFFKDCQNHLQEYLQNDLFSQHPNVFWRGTTEALGKKSSFSNCLLNHKIFEEFNIIPKYCFNCYKILIRPRTVVELIKLMLIFEKLYLPLDNPRKCLVEVRPQVPGTYVGLIYSRNIKETKHILHIAKAVISKGISGEVPVTIKRGCSEFSLAFPKFSKVDKNCKPVMRYKKEWQVLEDLADQNKLRTQQNFQRENYNHPSITLNDALNMLTWLKYAKTIGDLSYRKVTKLSIAKFQDLERPSFEPVNENK